MRDGFRVTKRGRPLWVNPFSLFSPKGNRTPVYGVRGRCPRPLDDGTIKMAEGPGFEPGLTESESVVLPLNDPPAAVREFLTIG